MKIAIDNKGIEVEVADNISVKTVDGIHYLLTPADEAAIQAKEAEYVASKVARDALNEIANLERAITPRRVREAILGVDAGWLSNQEAFIAAERSKLV